MSLTALVPDQKTYKHPAFPWLTVYPWRCLRCDRVVATRTSDRAMPGDCPVCRARSKGRTIGLVTVAQYRILRHTVGLDSAKKPYRNRYSPPVSGEALDDCRALKALGLMKSNGDESTFWLTPAGYDEALRGAAIRRPPALEDL